MNLRILKKLSKRAAPLLPLLGDDRQQFPAIKGDNYHGMIGFPRKNFERGRSVHADVMREGEIKTPAKDGNGWVYQWPPYHPLKGTVMVGATTGYYEPEWDEESAWGALNNLVWATFTDWSGEDPVPLRTFNGPGDIFLAAHELIAAAKASRPEPAEPMTSHPVTGEQP